MATTATIVARPLRKVRTAMTLPVDADLSMCVRRRSLPDQVAGTPDDQRIGLADEFFVLALVVE
ncbi:Uncharacterised protein [Mycobacteroides abscessus subsp. abscessus]|nr:Uncharacterised protein [Mycobacteroides abscessus subsp. abscessus]